MEDWKNDIGKFLVDYQKKLKEKTEDMIKDKLLEIIDSINKFEGIEDLMLININRLGEEEEKQLNLKIDELSSKINKLSYELNILEKYKLNGSEEIERKLNTEYANRQMLQNRVDSNKITIFGTKEQYNEFLNDIHSSDGLVVSLCEMNVGEKYYATPSKNIVVATDLSEIYNPKVGVEFLIPEFIYKKR